MAIGDIGTILATTTVSSEGITASDIIEVADGIYAIAYTGGSNTGRLVTFPMTDAGALGAAIATYQFDTTGLTPTLLRIGTTQIFLLCYQAASSVVAKTITINTDGTIGAVVDTLTIESTTSFARRAAPLHISGNVYAYAYQAPASASSYLRIRTFDCDSSGNLGAIIATKDIAVGGNKAIEFKHVFGTVYFAATATSTVNSTMFTFNINANGTFGASIDSWAFSVLSNEFEINMVRLYTGIYVMSWYNKTTVRGNIGTFNMTNAGIITKAFIDTVETTLFVYDTQDVGGGMVAFMQADGSGSSTLKTWGIDSAGNIDAAVHDTLLITSTGPSSSPRLRWVAGNVWAIAVTGPTTNDLYIKTASIESEVIPTGIFLELAFNQSIFSDPATAAWTDVTAELMELYTRRGRLHEFNNVEAGVANFLMKNLSGNWWRYNTASPYYGTSGDVHPITLIRLRRNYAGISYPVYYGVVESLNPGWASEEEAGLVPIMNIGCVDFFKSFTRFKLTDANPTLTADAVAGVSSAYVDSVANLFVGQSIRIYEGANTQTTSILAITPSLNLVFFNDLLLYTFHSGAAKLKKFPSVLTGTRINDCLLEMGYPLALSTVDAGTCYVVEHSPPVEGTVIMQHMYDVQQAEDGLLFQAVDGKVVFQDALARTKSPYNTSQATFRDDGTPNQFVHPELMDDETFIYNQADISGDAIGLQSVVIADQQAIQGPRVFTRSNSILLNAGNAFDQAYVFAHRYNDSILRCDSLLIKPDLAPANLLPKVLGYDLSTHITFLLNSTVNPALISQEFHIEGIEHRWNAREIWKTKWQLWMVNKYRIYRIGRQTNSHFDKVQNSDPVYATSHNAVNGNLLENDQATVRLGQMLFGGFHYIARGLLCFDTTDLAGLTPQSADIVVTLAGSQIIDTSFKLQITGPGAVVHPLTLPDYNTLMGQTANWGLSDLIASPWQPGQLMLIIHLTALGLAGINAGGITYFGIRSKNDVDSVAPTGLENALLYGVANPAPPPFLVVKLS